MDLYVPDNHYLYECSNGHWPTNAKPLKRCPSALCKGGTLTRYGKGSRGSYKTREGTKNG